MTDIFSWSKAKEYHCIQHRLSNTANHHNNSYFLLTQPNLPAYNCGIILLHGTGNDAWFPNASIIEAYLEIGCTVITANLPGHSRQDDSILDCDQLGTIVQALCTQVFAHSKIDGWILWGHSLGAAAIIDFLANGKPSNQIKGAVLVAMPLRPTVSWRSVASEILLPCLPSFWHSVPVYGFFGSLPAFGPFRRSSFPIRLHNNFEDRSYLKIISKWFSARDWLAAARCIKVPCCLLYGRLDRVAPAKDGIALRTSIPVAEITVLNWENHFTIVGSKQTAKQSVEWTLRTTETKANER